MYFRPLSFASMLDQPWYANKNRNRTEYSISVSLGNKISFKSESKCLNKATVMGTIEELKSNDLYYQNKSLDATEMQPHVKCSCSRESLTGTPDKATWISLKCDSLLKPPSDKCFKRNQKNENKIRVQFNKKLKRKEQEWAEYLVNVNGLQTVANSSFICNTPNKFPLVSSFSCFL